MRTVWIACGALLIAWPGFAQAQLYKCKQANGTASYQEEPCAKGEKGNWVNLPPVSSVAPQEGTTSAQNWQSNRTRGDSGALRGYNEQIRRENEETRRQNQVVQQHNEAMAKRIDEVRQQRAEEKRQQQYRQ